MAERRKAVWKVQIKTKDATETRLVKANTEHQAIRHAELIHIDVSEATADDILAFGAAGGKIEEALPGTTTA